jgi:hypothetical protein
MVKKYHTKRRKDKISRKKLVDTGFSRFRIIFASLIIFIILGLIYYFFAGYKQIPSQDSFSHASPTGYTEKDFDFIQDPILRKHYAAQNNIIKYTITTTNSEIPDDKVIEDTEVAGNRITMRVSKVTDGSETTRYIHLDDFFYIKDQQDGKWWKGRRNSTARRSSTDSDMFKTGSINAARSENLSLIGEERCGTLMCYIYEETNPAITKLIPYKYWIDKNEFLLRKVTYDVGEVQFTEEYTYTNFSPITIPSPVKDIPEGDKVSDYYLKYYVNAP